MLGDLRQAFRTAARTPGFTLVATLTLALGIGAATVVFSLADAVLVRPFPFHEPERLAAVWGESPVAGHATVEVSYRDYLDWRARNDAFSDLAVIQASDGHFSLPARSGTQGAVSILARTVSANLFRVLGVEPALGRAFLPGDDRPDAPPVVVISDRLWRGYFGADPAAVGREILLDGVPTRLVGVMPPDFRFPHTVEAWVPLQFIAATPESHGIRIFEGVGRLRPGLSLARAGERMAALSADLARLEPAQYRDYRASVRPLVDDTLGDTRLALRLLLGAVELLLLAAFADAAGLMLARAEDRRREIAVRTALGAGRPRLLRQFLAESSLLAAPAAALGLLLARGGLTVIAVIGPRDIPRLADAVVDGRAVVFALLVTLAALVLLGLLPALQIPHAGLAEALKEGTPATASRRASRARHLLAVAEIALTLVLMVGAGLMFRSFTRLQATDLGFEREGRLTFRVTLPGPAYPGPAEHEAYFRAAVERLQDVPGVERAAAVLLRPLSGPIGWEYHFTVEGQTDAQQIRNPVSNHERVSPGYFETMGIPLLQGRDFTWEDGPDAPRVAIVSRSMAEHFWPDGSALGRRLHWKAPQSGLPWLTVVGVVGDARYRDLTRTRFNIYVPFRQEPFWAMDFVLLSQEKDPLSLVPAVRAALAGLDPELPLVDVTTLDRAFVESLARPRLRTVVLVSFAASALMFAAVGLYGLTAWSVARRQHEIGVRLALGASRGGIFRLVLRQALALTLAGLAAGLATALALAATGWIDDLLHGVRPTDLATFTTVALVLLGAGLAAGLSPALRASEVEPRNALRGE